MGEWATASCGYGRGNRIQLTHELHFPHSPGLLYSAFTYFCGFRVNSGEYKLMGLAPYGEPKYADLILDKLIDLKPDGSFRMDLSYFNYCQGLTMTSRKFERLFGGPPRRPETPLTQREMDLAASIQVVTEEIMLRMARHVHEQTGLTRLCLAGGVALNCVANGRILREGPYTDLWIQPAAGDAGGALGVALFIWHQLLGHPPHGQPPGPATRFVPGTELLRGRDPTVLGRPGGQVPSLGRRRRTVRPRGRVDRARESRGLAAGPDGVRAAGAGRPQHPGRRPQHADAGGDEFEDQVPRVVPAVRAVRAGGAGGRVL